MPKVLSSTLVGSLRTAKRGAARERSRKAVAASVAKRGFDVGVVVTAMLVLLPLLATVALLIWIAQGRPILIRHNRVGRNGRLFPCLKFRTMVVDAENALRHHLAVNPAARSEWEATRKLKNDPRITPLGRVLRKSSVDELPQLLNILRGEMSLVGPRPIVTEEVKYYGAHIRQYHSVRPGMTGYWQIKGRNDVSYDRRVQLDTEYVANWSFALDLEIIAKTIPAVVRSRGCY